MGATGTAVQAMRLFSVILLLLASLFLCGVAAPSQAQASTVDRFFITSDGVRLHYADAGSSRPGAPILVFVPGWTMPGWIFQPQVDAFARRYRVVVLDPRGQGSSDVPTTGYTYDRRGDDIAELVQLLSPPGGAQLRVVLVGWSLGVLDSLAYVHTHGDAALAGMVLIDNSVGEDPPPPPPKHPYQKAPRQSHAAFMASFVRSMFKRPQPLAYLQQLTAAALRTPEQAANALLGYKVPRTYWKEAVYATAKPVLYVVRPGFAGQAGNLAAHHPAAETLVMPDLGHALFVDDAPRFNTVLQSFLTRRVGG
jgi:non-heme chloroperoxidase